MKFKIQMFALDLRQDWESWSSFIVCTVCLNNYLSPEILNGLFLLVLVHVCMCVLCVLDGSGQKKAMNPLELELQGCELGCGC